MRAYTGRSMRSQKIPRRPPKAARKVSFDFQRPVDHDLTDDVIADTNDGSDALPPKPPASSLVRLGSPA